MQNSEPKEPSSLTQERSEAASQRALRLVLAGILFSVLIWIGLLGLAPYLRSIHSPISPLLYSFFAPTCHQIDSRCLHIFGHPMAVCARCLGVYLGILIGTVLFPWLSSRPLRLPRPRTFLLFTAPIALDTFANMLHIWPTPSILRMLLGISWGLILPSYLIPGLTDLLPRLPRIFPLK